MGILGTNGSANYALTFRSLQIIMKLIINLYWKDIQPLLLRYTTDESGKTAVQAEIYTKDDHGIGKEKIDPDAYMITRQPPPAWTLRPTSSAGPSATSFAGPRTQGLRYRHQRHPPAAQADLLPAAASSAEALPLGPRLLPRDEIHRGGHLPLRGRGGRQYLWDPGRRRSSVGTSASTPSTTAPGTSTSSTMWGASKDIQKAPASERHPNGSYL
jgi:hypothetical protein